MKVRYGITTSLLALPFTVLAQSPCGSADQLHSGHLGNSGQDGIFFDIDAATPVTINCFESYFTTGGQNITRMYIWYRNGSHVGVETDVTQWQLIDSVMQFHVGPTQQVLLAIPIDVNVQIQAGSTAAFYITNGDWPGMTNTGIRYDPQDGGVGTVTASDANITIREGAGSYDRWTIFSGGRVFSGRVNYSPLSTEITQLATEPATFIRPNPVADRFTIDLGLDPTSSTLTITDLAGRTVRSEQVLMSGSYAMDASGLTAGTYILQVWQAGRVRSISFVKE
jgi:hypothetical protein